MFHLQQRRAEKYLATKYNEFKEFLQGKERIKSEIPNPNTIMNRISKLTTKFKKE